MRKGKYCNCCINNDTDKCNNCDHVDPSNVYENLPNFVPKNEFSAHFSWFGKDGYFWNSTKTKSTPTKSVVIHNTHYCPYCAQEMFPIQNPVTLDIIGHTCFCEGALSEIEYGVEEQQLLEKQEQERVALQNKFRPRLIADLHMLFEIKQQKDLSRFKFFNKDNDKCVGFRSKTTLTMEELI